MTTFAFDRNGNLKPVTEIPISERRHYYRSRNSINIINDEIEPTEHPVTRKIFTSKSAFRRETRMLGYEEFRDKEDLLSGVRKGWTEQKREKEVDKQYISEMYEKLRNS